MKLLCVACDAPMRLTTPAASRGEGVAMTFQCDACGHAVALHTNPGEADLLRDLGLRLTSQPGGQPQAVSEKPGLPETPGFWPGQPAAPPSAAEPGWTPEAERRLAAIPAFIQPMIRSAYNDYAREHGHAEITPEVMDAARASLDMGGFMS